MLLKKKNNLFYYLLLWAPYIAVYQVTNRFHIIEPRYLEFSVIDNLIPFLHWMVPVYVSYLAYVFFFIYRCKDDQDLTRIFLLSHFQLVFCAVFFVFFPVAFPVDLFYGQHNGMDFFAAFWRWFDAPANCFPSLHAANSLLVIYLVSKSPVWTGWAKRSSPFHSLQLAGSDLHTWRSDPRSYPLQDREDTRPGKKPMQRREMQRP